MGITGKPDPTQQAESDQAKPGKPGGARRATLEGRLEALMESERVGRELLEDLRAERWAAQQQDSEERLAAIEEALAEARTVSRQREEIQKALGEARGELVTLGVQLEQAKREAWEARREVKPRAARRIAEAEDELAEARAELKRERELRTKLEQDYEDLARSEQEAIEQGMVSSEEHAKAEQRAGQVEAEFAEARAEAERERTQRTELEQRVETLVALEKDAGQAHERQLAELERARDEAERIAAEAQQSLAQLRVERDRDRDRLHALEQQLVGAKDTTEAERRVAELEAELATARAEAGRERGQRAELEQRVERITAHAETQQVLRQQRAEQAREGEHLPGIEQLRGIEQLLGVEQRQGIDQLLQRLSDLAQSGSEAPQGGPPQTREPAPRVLEALQPTRAERGQETPEPAGGAPLTPEEMGEAPQPRKGGILRRRRRGRTEMITCAVCKRTEANQSPEEAEADGWILRSDLSLCPQCKSKGWQLPEAGGLPFRRPSARQTSD